MPTNLDTLLSQLHTLHTRIASTCVRVKRDPSTIELLPVTKGHGAEKIRQLYDLGFRRFGENYVQELQQKAAQLTDLPDLHWVFLGRLQSNKINQLVMVCNEIHALDQVSHAARLAQAATRPIRVYLAVNCGVESHKTGVPLSQIETFAREVTAYPSLEIQGLFALPPENLEPTDQHQLYAELATRARSIGKGKLSLGMSQDLEAAIEAGSTLVRVGTALLGPRESK